MKAYFVCEKGEYEGVGVVADNEEEAIELAEGELMDMYGIEDINEIEIEVEEMDADVDGLEKGIIDCIEGLKRDIYSICENSGEPCPICGDTFGDMIKEEIDGKAIIACTQCIRKIEKLVNEGKSVDEAIEIVKREVEGGDAGKQEVRE